MFLLSITAIGIIVSGSTLGQIVHIIFILIMSINIQTECKNEHVGNARHTIRRGP